MGEPFPRRVARLLLEPVTPVPSERHQPVEVVVEVVPAVQEGLSHVARLERRPAQLEFVHQQQRQVLEHPLCGRERLQRQIPRVSRVVYRVRSQRAVDVEAPQQDVAPLVLVTAQQ